MPRCASPRSRRYGRSARSRRCSCWSSGCCAASSRCVRSRGPRARAESSTRVPPIDFPGARLEGVRERLAVGATQRACRATIRRMNTPLSVGLVQQRCGEDRDANLAASARGIRGAAGRGARLVLLPELHTGVYFCQSADPARFDQAEPVPGPTTHALGALAKELGVTVVGSVSERRAPGLYHNTAVVLGPDGELAGRYRKMHIPDDPGYYEKFYFTPGDQGFVPIDAGSHRLGVLVCWDQ